MRFLVVIFLFINFSNVYAQLYSIENVNSKAQKLYGKALAQVADGNLKEATTTIKKAIEADANYVDAYLSLAGIYGELKDYNNAIENYKIALEKDSQYSSVYRLPLLYKPCWCWKI